MDTIINVGDEIRVQIKRRASLSSAVVVSTFTGKVVKADHAALGFYGFVQYKLDNGYWFSPMADTILEHKPCPLPTSC